MDFWEHAFDSLGDNFMIAWAASADLAENLNPLSDQFLSGDAINTAREVEEQRARDEGREIDPERIRQSASGGLELIEEGAGQTAAAVGHEVGTVVGIVTNPWVVGAVVTLAIAILAAPYVVPAMKAVRS